MTCSRCSGLLVHDHPLHFTTPANCREDHAIPARRCLNCGNVEDAVVLSNRADQRAAQWRGFQQQIHLDAQFHLTLEREEAQA